MPKTANKPVRKLTVLSGLCGSGKSTLARELWGCNPKSMLLSYDEDARANCSSNDPVLIMHALFVLAGFYLRYTDNDLIIDACNLHPHDAARWEAIAWAWGMQFDWVRMNTPVDLCILRDQLRADPVGSDVIRGQAEGTQLLLEGN